MKATCQLIDSWILGLVLNNTFIVIVAIKKQENKNKVNQIPLFDAHFTLQPRERYAIGQ
jgi:hypothetical protein